MNVLELANRVQLAALPEAEYKFIAPKVGLLEIAYPEARVGLRLSEANGVTEIDVDGWMVIETGAKNLDVQAALTSLKEHYQERLRAMDGGWVIPPVTPQERATRLNDEAPGRPPAWGEAAPITVSDAVEMPRVSRIGLSQDREQWSSDWRAAAQTAAAGPEITEPDELMAIESGVSSDLRKVLVEYLGRHIIDALPASNPDLPTWWRHFAECPETMARVERAARLLERSGV